MQPYSCTAFSCFTTKCIYTPKTGESLTKEVIRDTSEHVWFPFVFKNSTHHDGAIYENTVLREDWLDFDFADRKESKWSKSQSYLSGFYSYLE